MCQLIPDHPDGEPQTVVSVLDNLADWLRAHPDLPVGYVTVCVTSLGIQVGVQPRGGADDLDRMGAVIAWADAFGVEPQLVECDRYSSYEVTGSAYGVRVNVYAINVAERVA